MNPDALRSVGADPDQVAASLARGFQGCRMLPRRIDNMVRRGIYDRLIILPGICRMDALFVGQPSRILEKATTSL